MFEVQVGIIVLGLVLFFETAYMWKQLSLFKSNLDALIMEVENNLRTRLAEKKEVEKAKLEKEEFDNVKEQILLAFQRNKIKCAKKAAWGPVAMGASAGYFAFCATHIYLGHGHTWLVILPTPLIAACVFMLYAYLLDSEECCVFESSSASDMRTWLGLILVSIPAKGKLRLVQGSMYPYLFEKDWFVNILKWLKNERKVRIQIVSGKPDFDKMDDKQYQRWKRYWDNFTKYGLEHNLRIVSERPDLQYTVTNNLIRVEKDHSPWVVREKEGPDQLVPNHIRLFNSFLIREFHAKFEKLWESGKPAIEVLSSREVTRSQN